MKDQLVSKTLLLFILLNIFIIGNVHAEIENKRNYITIGDSVEHVIEVQGTPTSINNYLRQFCYSKYCYDSYIGFDYNWKVIEFSNKQGNLKISLSGKPYKNSVSKKIPSNKENFQ